MERSQEKVRIRGDEVKQLISRCCPHSLMEATRKMNEAQLDMVRKMGFGDILGIDISRLPNKLCFWLVDNFDPKRSEIVLSDGRRIEVNELDVYRVFGFPRGGLEIRRKKKFNDRTLVVDEWVGQFTETGVVDSCHKISVNHVTSALLKDESAGKMFRSDFLVLLASSLIQTSSNGYLYPLFSEPLEEESDSRQWNWCQFLIRCLIDTCRTWRENQTKPFFGPSLFLLILYVDRVMMFNEQRGRQLPLFKNWDRVLLRNRQEMELKNGGFGDGRILEAVVVETLHSENRLNEVGLPEGRRDTVGPCTVQDESLKYSAIIMKQAESVACQMVKLMKMIEDAPSELFNNNSFKKTVDATSKIIGSSLEESVSLFEGNEKEIDGDFWNAEETKEAMFAIDTTRLMVKSYLDDLPSFSLGMTQHFRPTKVDKGKLTENKVEPPTTGKNISTDNEGISKYANVDCLGSQFIPDEDVDELGRAIHAIADVVVSLNEEHGNSDKDEEMRVGEHTGEGVQLAGVEGVNIDERQSDVGPEQGVSDKAEEEEKEKGERSSKAAVTSRMPCRNKSSKKSASAMKSPYLLRYVDAAKNLTKMEITVCYFCIFVADDNCLLCEWKYFKIFAQKMRGLKQSNWIDNVIIDAWSSILNEREQVKSDESPLRLFAPLRSGTVVCPEKEINSFKKQEIFNLGMATTLTRHKVANLNKIQLYVFPIENEGCYFMICFDLRLKRTFIIDNTTDHKSIDMKVKYGNIPNDLTYLLSQYLKETKCTSRAKLVEKCECEMIIPVWGNRTKVFDSGVYLMRHMETFKGGLTNWDTGFLKKGVKQIKLLRMRYCLSLVNFDENKMKETVELEAVGHADENEVDSKECVKELLDS